MKIKIVGLTALTVFSVSGCVTVSGPMGPADNMEIVPSDKMPERKEPVHVSKYQILTSLEKIENGQRYPEFMSSSLTHPAFPYWIFIEQPALALKLRLRPNYGLVDIDWNEGGPIKVKYNIMSSYTGRRVRTHTIRLGPEGWVGIK